MTMKKLKNALFIMCDQLRWDYLSCYGGTAVDTPHIDNLAARGVRFDAAYVQSAVCVPSRMSYYTGRYVTSHGATWNYVPLSIAQKTLGDFLGDAGRDVALTGKTHVIPDYQGLRKVGLSPDSERGRYLKNGGFNEVERYDGHAIPGPESNYAQYLRKHGYDSQDPWSDYVIGALDEQGRPASGWLLRNAHLPARVDKAHSETAYMTDCALDYIQEQGDAPWVLHLSYIKPHWPLMAPAPYHEMYREAALTPVVGADVPDDAVHPVVAAYRAVHEDCKSYQQPDVVAHVKPTYMGLVKEVDDNIGRLMAALQKSGRLDDTLIVFCSDHGDYLGDHGLGEKELFYEQAIRTPMIVVDPRPEADATRGSHVTDFVEAIDVLPTILDAVGIDNYRHVLEGRSLMPFLHEGKAPQGWREAVFCELDYSFRDARLHMGRKPDECYAWMVRTRDWKYVKYLGLRPQLFDMRKDPQELNDLGQDAGHEAVRNEMERRLHDWHVGLKYRPGIDDASVERGTEGWKKLDMKIGVW